MNPILHALTRLDPDCPWEELWEISVNSTPQFIAYVLATWLHDNDFGVNEEGWEMLENIKKRFNKEVYDLTLQAVFTRNHST